MEGGSARIRDGTNGEAGRGKGKGTQSNTHTLFGVGNVHEVNCVAHSLTAWHIKVRQEGPVRRRSLPRGQALQHGLWELRHIVSDISKVSFRTQHRQQRNRTIPLFLQAKRLSLRASHLIWVVTTELGLGEKARAMPPTEHVAIASNPQHVPCRIPTCRFRGERGLSVNANPPLFPVCPSLTHSPVEYSKIIPLVEKSGLKLKARSSLE